MLSRLNYRTVACLLNIAQIDKLQHLTSYNYLDINGNYSHPCGRRSCAGSFRAILTLKCDAQYGSSCVTITVTSASFAMVLVVSWDSYCCYQLGALVQHQSNCFFMATGHPFSGLEPLWYYAWHHLEVQCILGLELSQEIRNMLSKLIMMTYWISSTWQYWSLIRAWEERERI